MKRKVKFEQTTLLMVGINQAAIGQSIDNHCTVGGGGGGGGGGERGRVYMEPRGPYPQGSIYRAQHRTHGNKI